MFVGPRATFGESFTTRSTDWLNDSNNSFARNLFMRALLSSLVATSLLIHAVIGCCWHHTHADGCCEASQFELATDSDGGQPRDQHDGHSHGPCKAIIAKARAITCQCKRRRSIIRRFALAD